MNPIVAAVAARGRVTFADFMALALYHPEGGFYTRERSGAGPAGPRGDFLTAPTATPLFALTLALLLERLGGLLGQGVTFVELGAGEGLLLEAVEAGLGEARDAAVTRVVAVEVAQWARGRVRERCPRAEVVARLEDAPTPRGPVVLFASELYDALPVHRVTVVRRAGELRLAEHHVEADGRGGLRLVVDELSTDAIAHYLAAHTVVLEEGQIAEVRLGAESLHRDHVRWCGTEGVALVLDYGYPARQLYNARGRRRGTLVGYREHKSVEDPLERPGEVDLTAHVNFDDLERAAAACGWERGELRAVGSFLALHGAVDLLPAAAASGAPLTAEEWAELATAKKLLVPAGMGADLKVLAQGRGRAWHAYRKLATPPLLEA